MFCSICAGISLFYVTVFVLLRKVNNVVNLTFLTLTIFAFVSSVFSKQFAGSAKHVKLSCKSVVIKTCLHPAGAAHSNVGCMTD